MTKRNRGFLDDVNEAFKRSINPFYRGRERDFIDGLSLGVPRVALQEPWPPQSANELLTGEMLRHGYGADVASAVTQALSLSIARNDYTDIIGRLRTEGEQGSSAAQVTLGALHWYGK